MSSFSVSDIESLLDSEPLDSNSVVEFNNGGAEESSGVSWCEKGYTGTIDYRLRQLSHSTLQVWRECKRKFQLNRHRVSRTEEESIDTKTTFSFGHVIGDAIQQIFQNISREEIIFNAFIRWNGDLFYLDEKRGKSLWLAYLAIDKFLEMRKAGFFSEYELVYYEGKPACEFSFCINFPDGFRYRGFVDLIFRHLTTGKILVLECKTYGSDSLNPASYKNSAQALGYSIVLDHLFPELSSYEVLYLVYQSRSKEYTPIPFTKSYTQRARWIRELIFEVETIKRCVEEDLFSTNGDVCISRFGKECEYLGVCTLSDEHLLRKCTAEAEDKTVYQVNVGLVDLINTQLRKVGAL